MKKTHAITRREEAANPPPRRPSLKEFCVGIPDVTYVLREI